MNFQDLGILLDYHYWARDRMFEAVSPLTPEQYTKDLGNSFRSVRDTIVHTYSAEWNWYSRWTGNSPTSMLDPNQFPDLASVRSAWKSQEERVRSFVQSLGEKNVDRVFEYRLMNGQEAKSVFWHMLQHVVNHASYHRGQVTTLLRQLGVTPPKSQDLIAFYRERTTSLTGNQKIKS
jgi:uncharacterized damage-inducible protein DinB